jgi:hypothetical protein
MDELTFRRTIYADPNTQDADVIAAAKADPSKQAFWNEVKALDNQIFAAAQVKVPENLADKLLLKQSFEERHEERNKRPWYIAMAASVAVAAFLTFNVMQPITGNALAKDVFAHVDEAYMEKEMMMSNGKVDLDQVNSKMATFNGSVNGDLGEVVSANYCYLDKIKSLHLIIKGENGLINMFVMPEDLTESLQETFNSATMFGTSFLLESAKIIIVGEDGEEVKTVKESAQQTLRFSA